MTMKPLAIAAALSLTLGSAFATVAPAYARDVTVSYADLNLETEAGRNVLERRLEKAAQDVCEVDARASGSRFAPRAETECLAKARSLATEQVAQILERQALGG